MTPSPAHFDYVVRATQSSITQLRKQAAELEAALAQLHRGTVWTKAAEVTPSEGETYVGRLFYPTTQGTVARSAPGIFRWSSVLGWLGPQNQRYPDVELEILFTAATLAAPPA